MSLSIASLAQHRASTTAAKVPGAFSWGQYSLRALVTVIAATVANVLVYALASTAVAYEPEFVVLANPSGVVVFTVVPAVGAGLLYAGLLRFTRWPAALFGAFSAIVFVVTLIPDFTYIPTVPGSSPSQTAVLVLMHVVAAVVIVRLLTASPTRRAR